MTKSMVRTRRKTAARTTSRARRHLRVRKKISGTPERPRLVVTRSSKHIVAQVIDDIQGHTLASASSMDSTIRGGEKTKTERSQEVGALLAQRATEAGISTVVFDRGGYKYHGRIAALADSARGGGLEF